MININMDGDIKIVRQGKYDGYEYFVVYVINSWYCAYVILPEGHKYYGVQYDSIPIEAHGGLTFSNNHRLVDGKWCIGWDYCHIGDWTPLMPDHLQIDWRGVPAHKWEPDEIVSDCKYVIDQLNGKD